MSPDRLTLTRSEALRRRKEEEKKLREKLTQKRASTPKPAPALQPAAQPKAERAAPRISPSVSRSRFRARYDVAAMPVQARPVSAVHAQAPAMTLPRVTFGPRWFSLLLVIACVTMMYFYVTEPLFLAQEAVIHGNQRVPAQDINSILGIANQPAAFLNPAQIEYNIRASFPEIYGAYVQIELPAKVTITVAERQPVAAWMQDGQVVWVDAHGYAFPPRGEAEGLVTVTATGSPPTPEGLAQSPTIGARPFLRPELSTAIATLAPQVPEGATLIYDPQYGLGWADPRGWRAYFGKNNHDMTTKLLVYQSLVETLAARGVQPTIISVEYPNSPFYRLSKSD